MKTGPRRLVASLLLACLGCTTFQPASVESVPLGTTVRARLDAEGEARVRDLTRREASSVDGTLVRKDPGGVVLEVWRTDLAGGRVFDPGRVQVPLAREHIVDLRRERLSWFRTGTLVTALAGGLYLLFEAFWGGVGGGGRGDGGGPEI